MRLAVLLDRTNKNKVVIYFVGGSWRPPVSAGRARSQHGHVPESARCISEHPPPPEWHLRDLPGFNPAMWERGIHIVSTVQIWTLIGRPKFGPTAH